MSSYQQIRRAALELLLKALKVDGAARCVNGGSLVTGQVWRYGAEPCSKARSYSCAGMSSRHPTASRPGSSAGDGILISTGTTRSRVESPAEVPTTIE